ncbi:ABC transporter substrate-binding protein [Aeromicrobium sp. 636]|uniref:ABC transporter substrate-binding protein n=2 Tax=Nocardioidaceae TaxID=85015 RepID=A0A8I0EV23_9ACTN|nr:ABC transporter substrate-binding protein [Aeromicrobium senzhongii]MCQ3999036.1 ABC transporter substrate-binding protein [Aeromicrobium sp. 636]MTB89457.1 ABC transporter substrate-binding protein [Aeromicrobium senzhongii]QNL94406.1 ABC transporter substrate-binding protein [Aeromicrobium senzhongii]
MKMKQHRRLTRVVAGAAVAALVLTGCRSGGDEESSAGPGITEEACPDAVNKDNGCIYLGVISDLTKGPFAPLAVPITEAQKAFWNKVNEDGGVGGYDVNIEKYIADAEYNPEIHNKKYQEMRNDILALGQTLGSSQTLAILEDMKADNVIGVPASWNSAWDFEDQIMQSGASYCFEAMNGVDWAVQERGVKQKVLAIHYPNDYGGDAAAGVEAAAKANNLDFASVETATGQDNQAGAVAAVLKQKPDLLYITTGPAEMATILGGAAAQGWKGTVVGSSPTWNPALLKTEAAPALQAMYFQAGPWGPWGTDSPGHDAMRKALADVESPSDGYTAGWVWEYPLLAALKSAADMDGGVTRENVVKAASELESVDYEGMLPDESFNKNGEPNEVAWRQSVISKVDPKAPTGVSITKEMAAGPTAEGYDYTEPCFALQG